MRHLLTAFLLCSASALSAQATAAPKATFEVISVKPSSATDNNTRINTTPQRVMFENATLRQIILISYGIRSTSQVQGMPDWVTSERYNIDAKMDEEMSSKTSKLTRDERQAMLMSAMQSLLQERFHIKTTWSKKELPVYAITVLKTGPKLKTAAIPPPPPDADPSEKPKNAGTSTSTTQGSMEVTNGSMELLANQLSRMPEMDGRVVVDKTGLKGSFDWKLEWAPEGPQGTFRGADSSGNAPPPSADTSKPTLFTAIQEQLGLKLEQDKAPVDLLIIDHIEKPTEN